MTTRQLARDPRVGHTLQVEMTYLADCFDPTLRDVLIANRFIALPTRILIGRGYEVPKMTAAFTNLRFARAIASSIKFVKAPMWSAPLHDMQEFTRAGVRTSAQCSADSALRTISCCLVLLCGASVASAQTNSIPMRLGMSAPLSGTTAADASAIRGGMQACLSSVNEAGGVHGHPVELEVLDDQGDTVRALENVRTFARDPRVVGAIVYGDAAASHLVSEAAIFERLPLVGIGSGIDDEADALGARRIFHMRAGHREELAALVVQLDFMGLESPAVVYENDALGIDGLNWAKIELNRLAMAPKPALAIAADGRDAASLARQLVATVPKAVILVAGPIAVTRFVRAMAALGQHPRYLASSDADGDELALQLGALARGIGVTQVLPPPGSTRWPYLRDFHAAMRKSGAAVIGYRSLEGCIATRVLVDALRRAGRELSRERLAQALEVTDLDLGNYRVRFSGGEHRGSRFVDPTVIGSDGRIAR